MIAIFAKYEAKLQTIQPAEAFKHSGLSLQEGQMVKQVSLESLSEELAESTSEQTFAKVLGILETKHVFWLLNVMPQGLLRRLKREFAQTSASI